MFERFIQIRVCETVAGLAAASLVTLALAPIAALAPASYAAPQVFPFNAGAHILPFDGIEDPATAGIVTINGGDVLLPTKFEIAGGAANNTDVASYSCPAGPERTLVLEYDFPTLPETINAPYARVPVRRLPAVRG